MKEQKISDWKLIGHSHQIADTGDYDGHYEITNGKISLLTQDDDDESLQPIVGALNDSGCKFYQDDWFEFENKMLKEDVATLWERVKELEGENFNLAAHQCDNWKPEENGDWSCSLQSQLAKYREALESIANAEDLGIKVDPLGIALLMKKRAKEALKQQ